MTPAKGSPSRVALLIGAAVLFIGLGAAASRLLMGSPTAQAPAPAAAQSGDQQPPVTAGDPVTQPKVPKEVVAYTGTDVAWERGPWGDTTRAGDRWDLMPRSAAHGPFLIHPDGHRSGFAQTPEGACLAEWTFATQLLAAPPAVRAVVQQESTLDGAGYSGIEPGRLNQTDSWVPPNDPYLPTVAPAERPHPAGCQATAQSAEHATVSMAWRWPGGKEDTIFQTDWVWKDGSWVLTAPLNGDYFEPPRAWASPQLDHYLIEAPR